MFNLGLLPQPVNTSEGHIGGALPDMSTLAEIQEAIHKLSPAKQTELRQCLLEKEAAAMMATIAEGVQRVEQWPRAKFAGLPKPSFAAR